MIIEPPGQTAPPRSDGTTRVARRRTPLWRHRRVQLGALSVVLAVILVAALSRSQTGAPTAVTPAAAAPLIAHGQILPARQARVGTQGGGVVQQLDATPGAAVDAQKPLAWVLGPSGTEVVTAPFAGSVTNVLVHAGDTLTPGAPIAIVADLRALQVETSDVDEFLVSKVSVGQRVQISVDALDNRSMTGTVANVALLPQTGSTGSAAYPVIISVGSLPSEVRPGMSVRVTFPEPGAS